MESDSFADRIDVVSTWLAEYVCGVVWSIALIVVLSMVIHHSTATSCLAEVVRVLREIHPPELAIGFGLVIGGVLFPLVVQFVCSPISGAMSSRLEDRWSKARVKLA